jgi:hypothetical protein
MMKEWATVAAIGDRRPAELCGLWRHDEPTSNGNSSRSRRQGFEAQTKT